MPGAGTMAMQLVAWCLSVGVQHMNQLLEVVTINGEKVQYQIHMWTLETGDYWGYFRTVS